MAIFQCGYWRWGFWVRLFGVGFGVRRLTKFGLLFSEREGYTRYLKIGQWVIKPLGPVR